MHEGVLRKLDSTPTTTGDQISGDAGLLGRIIAKNATDPTIDDRHPATSGHVDGLSLLEQLQAQSGRPTDPKVVAMMTDSPQNFGRFQTVRVLGQGGFGIVYLARDHVLGRDVALKVPRPGMLVTPDVRRRFLREARAAASLDHPSIVPVYEAGELETTCYIASTYCPGPTLASWLRARSSPVPARVAARLIHSLADAVQHAHEHDVFHRDIKPSNIILTTPYRSVDDAHGATLNGVDTSTQVGEKSDGPTPRDAILHESPSSDHTLTPRLTDFGLARIVEEVGDESLTGVAIGSPPYMAPEQAAGRTRETGPGTDVYSLGATLYEVLTGRPPFRGETPTETLRMVLEEDPVPPRLLRPGLPRDLETICSKCLAKGQAQRYATASALRDDLQRFLDGRPIIGRPLSRWQQTLRQLRRKPAHALSGVLAVLLLITVFGAMLHQASMREFHTRSLEVQIARADANARLVSRQLEASQLRQACQRVATGQFERAQDILREISPPPGPGGGLKYEFAWQHLWARSRVTLSLLSRRKEQVSCMALSPGDAVLATGDEDGTICLRDPRTGDPRANLRSHVHRVELLAFSRDGLKLASTARAADPILDDELVVWDLRQLRPLFRFQVPGGKPIQMLRFDARGDRIWCNGPTQDDRPTLYQLSFPGEPASPSLDWHRQTVPGFPMSPDGRLIGVEGAGRALRLRRGNDGREQPEARTGVRSPNLAALSPSGRLMAYQPRESVTVIVRDLGSGKDRAGSDEVHGVLARLEFSPDERYLLSTTHQGEFVLRDLKDGRRWSTSTDGSEIVACYAAFSPDSRQLAFEYNSILRGPHAIQVLDLETFQVAAKYPGEVDRLVDLLYTRDGSSILVRTTEALIRWDLRPTPETAQPSGHDDEAWAVAYSPDGRFLASGSDDTDESRTIKVWDPSDGHLLRSWNAGRGTVSALAFSPTESILVSAHLAPTENLKLWDPGTGNLLAVLDGHTDRVRSIAFSPDGRFLASCGSDRTVKLWDLGARRCIEELRDHTETLKAVAFSGDGRRIASAGCDQTIRVWEWETGRVVSLPWVEKFSDLVFLPGGSKLAASDEDGRITIWDIEARTCKQTIDTEDRELTCLGLSPDGETLAAAGKSHVVRLWDVVTGQELISLDGHMEQVNGVAFAPDGRTLASCDHHGEVHLWRSTR